MNITVKTIKQHLKDKEILEGNFGLEKEGLRITSDGKLATTPHPEEFGDKTENPYITTDFSESQIEIVTPTFQSIDETYEFLDLIVDIVNSTISSNEYIWTQSIPPILPKDDEIPIARYNNHQMGISAEKYRQGLAKKYGTKKQMLSGIHYNFSFTDETIEKLYQAQDTITTLKEFKDQLYLKIVRNYMRYKWFLIYITGVSSAAHKTFKSETKNLLDKCDNFGGIYSDDAISIRNSSCGYKNLIELYPRYDSVENFTTDVKSYIEKGYLSEAKELYTQIRLKPADPINFLTSLKDGIRYIELRTLDINPYNKNGIEKDEMKFIHLFIIYMLLKEESDYEYYQQEGFRNEEKVAEKGLSGELQLKCDGKDISLKKWANEILLDLIDINAQLNLGYDGTIKYIKEKLENKNNTYSMQLINDVKNKGFINMHIDKAVEYKKQSVTQLKQTLNENPQAKIYYDEAIE